MSLKTIAAYDAVPIPEATLLKKTLSRGYSSTYSRPAVAGWKNVTAEGEVAASESRARRKVAEVIKSMYENIGLEDELVKAFDYGRFRPPMHRSERYTCLYCNRHHAEMTDEQKHSFRWPTHGRVEGGLGQACRGSGKLLGQVEVTCGYCDANFIDQRDPVLPPGHSYMQAQVPDHSNPSAFNCPGAGMIITLAG